MAVLTVEEIIEATGGELLSEGSGTFAGVSIDSRTISEDEIFFALRGERLDGHDFLKDALLKGSGAIVDSRPGSMPEGKVIIYVEDTLKALQDLAHFLRMKQDIQVVAVTGSNGKTTTKEMIYAILSRKFKVLKNEGNLNNHIGLPLSLTRLTPDDEVVVLELGMNAAGEIRKLCEIAVPSHGIITNIGSAHLGKLGSYDAIRNAKFEILHGLAVAVVNADDSFLMQGLAPSSNLPIKFNGRIIAFSVNPDRKLRRGFPSNGVNNDSHVMAEDVHATEGGSNFTLKFKDNESVPVSLNVPGLFNVYNALAAAALCFSLGITVEEIRTALEGYRALPMRFELIKEDEMTLINDSYNANPSSMENALRELVRLGDRKRVVAILGDMLELGEFSDNAHKSLGRMVSEMDIDVFIAVGEMMSLAAEECRKRKGEKSAPAVYTFKDVDAAKKNVMDILKRRDTVLIKASRAIGMERIMGGIINVI